MKMYPVVTQQTLPLKRTAKIIHSQAVTTTTYSVKRVPEESRRAYVIFDVLFGK